MCFSSCCLPSIPIIRTRKLNFRQYIKNEVLVAHSAEKRGTFFVCGNNFLISTWYTKQPATLSMCIYLFIRKSLRSLENRQHFTKIHQTTFYALFNRDFHLLFKLDQNFQFIMIFIRCFFSLKTEHRKYCCFSLQISVGNWL